jgi:hypothetical protein
MNINDGNRQALIDMFHLGHNITEVARISGVPYGNVRHLANEVGIKRSKGRCPNPSTTEVEVSLRTLADTAARLLSSEANYVPGGRGITERIKAQTKKSTEKADLACDMAALGLSLREIGAAMGCTQEWARQLLLSRGVNIRELREEQRLERGIVFPLLGFRRAMYRHLHDCNFHRCGVCGWQERDKFPTSIGTVCTACGSRRARDRYREDPSWREHLRRYRALPAQKEKLKQQVAARRKRALAKVQGLKEIQ